ncbi:MAG TPA: glucoamylase family protein [Clostridia bacterium]|nr:glucoamylase family protein [Clostridia bacterium]
MSAGYYYLYMAAGVLAVVLIILLSKLLYVIDRDEPEVYDAILNAEELERHALEIARKHVVGKSSRMYYSLETRMNKNFRFITSVYKDLNEYSNVRSSVTPAAEWLLDNFYIVEEQVKEIRQNLSKKYYSQLPRLKSGALKGYPRVYAIALELVSHTDGRFDDKQLVGFVTAYQTQSLLSSGELWTIPMMVRMALIEHIRHVCESIALSQQQWYKAEKLAEQLLSYKDRKPEELLALAKESMKHLEAINPSYGEHLLNRLKKHGIEIAPIIYYIDERLSEQHTTSESITHLEHKEQASRQVSMGNSITSLRFISTLDWKLIFEELSRVEQILRQDPVDIYSKMDFPSRDSYRHEVEKLSKKLKVSEIQVAKKLIECAVEDNKHIGYYLFRDEKEQLLNKIGHPGASGFSVSAMYFFSISTITAFIVLILLNYAYNSGVTGLGKLILITLAVLIPASDVAVSLINWILVHIKIPAFLPKLELREGIPGSAAAIVVVPTLLTKGSTAVKLLLNLEEYYLANREENLYFALLGDYKDHDRENAEGDQEIITAAIMKVRELNKKYGKDADRFFFFHRKRIFNKAQNRWMGWERKRGALYEFNELLLGSRPLSFEHIEGNISVLKDIKYVITIDADTKLSIETARRLLGTVTHPLNKAVVDESRGIVREGYGLLQPRISVNITSANASRFARIFAGQGGIDIYTNAVSDVYQDYFGEGIFTGKGIYELAVFQGILRNMIPENTVLSHDLIEGSHVRVGLVTDIELIDGYPSGYNAHSMRQHRWVRGDWQLLRWLFGRVSNAKGQSIKNPLSAINRWKILDNMRRSLVAPSEILLFLLSLSIMPGNALVWFLFTLAAAVFPIFINFAEAILIKYNEKLSDKNGYGALDRVRTQFIQSMLVLTFLPHQAQLMLDAIVKTLVRVLITKKNMLEWITAADMELALKNDIASYWRRMWICPAAAAVAVVLSIFNTPEAFFGVLVLAVLWTAAPSLAHWISKPRPREKNILGEKEVMELRELTRKTWGFFEDFVSALDNYLPPDNYQENPPNGVAHRTSPTNIGLLLASIMSARDMGYISTREMLERLDNTITTIEKLKKWRGHLYNWYDTITLEVLRPSYISTVDSGNFIAYLMTLRQGLLEYQKRDNIDKSMVLGLQDTSELVRHEDEQLHIPARFFKNALEGEELEYSRFRELLEEIIRKSDLKRLNWGIKLHKAASTFLKDINHEGIKEDTGEIDGKLNDLIARIDRLIEDTSFLPLFDNKRKLFSIGYNEEEEQLTKSYYDLLASEARQASLIAIARGEVKKEHWFMLNRTLTSVNGYKGLLSWTGTMFEYLMPLLIMKDYPNTLLHETYDFVIECQKDYGRKRKVPWGVSESGYYAFDFRLNYQYKAFGIPSLGLKRGLINDTVIAPYATVLALMVDPGEAAKNIMQLKEEGLDSRYGFYEAIDYTPERLKKGKKSSIVRSFMAHHQGMSLLALNNIINDYVMQERFHREPVIKAVDILMQEKIPSRVIFAKDYKEKIEPFDEATKEDIEYTKVLGLNNNILPEVHMLSNGDYSVMVTDNGSGFSKYRDLAVTRWREDSILNNSGMFFYIQDIDGSSVWSNSLNPCGVLPNRYKVVFSQDKISIARTDGDIDTGTEIIVSPEDDVEIRRLTLTNHSQQPRILEVTSYFEVTITPQSADLAHPAFSNLFIRTEYLHRYNTLLAVRRPREEKKSPVYAFHELTVKEEVLGGIQYETDRARFIGRGNSVEKPAAVEGSHPLSNTVGPVLDPIMSLRCRVRLQPGQTVKLNYITGISDDKEKIMLAAEKYHDCSSIDRAFELAWTRSQVEMRYLNLRKEEIELYRQLMSQIIYLSPLRRRQENAIRDNRKGQPGLWSYGISGDLPIVLAYIEKAEEIDFIKELLKAHEYWRLKGLIVDIVIVNEEEGSYSQPLYNLLQDMVSVSHARDIREKAGGVFIKQGRSIPEEDKQLLSAAARIVVRGRNGALSVQTKVRNGENVFEYKRWKDKGKGHNKNDVKPIALQGFNGYGGFDKEGREYVIKLTEGMNTPVPWSNIVANKSIGFLVTESGASTTWAENSRENKLTTWSNDPVLDPSGEIIYMRDENTGEIWSVTPRPIRTAAPYIIRHGFGYSVFEHGWNGIEHELTEFAPVSDSVKLCVLKLKNTTASRKQLSATYYARTVLGVSDQSTAQHVYTELHGNGAILIRNNYNTDFPDRIAFLDTNAEERYYTGDRREFLGNMGSLKHPEALRKDRLPNTLGAGFDPCACIQAIVELKPREQKELVFMLGQYDSHKAVSTCTEKYRNIKEVYKALAEVKAFWEGILRKVEVTTPDKNMDIMLNGWLLYQTINCRMWARTAFYQSGGAYGFRDQLQDSLAVLNALPELTKNQILFHAAHQFLEGDVQHWWHPGSNKGIRTRFSDDLLWLPYVTINYINRTGDIGILENRAEFLEDEQLKEGEDERYNIPYVSDVRTSLYDHCIRAIERALKFGHHGIPLMGSGDWNDGMSTVGNKGKGESVWLGWFLYDILINFSELCRLKKDMNKADRYMNIAKEIAKAQEENAWDGNWYRRAYFDNGLPLGSAENTECKIDSIAQSWAVISGAANPERIREAMGAVEQYLIKKDDGLIMLLTPPFEEGDMEPGYIKGYLPGVRENGGQYTHAAVWVVMAYAIMGNGDKAWELFNMLNPINHANTMLEASRYKVEPYVMAADVYAVPPHTGRGGWTWYTGASGWMYNVGMQQILGFKKKGDRIVFEPCIPKDWSEYNIKYMHGRNTTYSIIIRNPDRVSKGEVTIVQDGTKLEGREIMLVDDGMEHKVEVSMR